MICSRMYNFTESSDKAPKLNLFSMAAIAPPASSSGGGGFGIFLLPGGGGPKNALSKPASQLILTPSSAAAKPRDTSFFFDTPDAGNSSSTSASMPPLQLRPHAATSVPTEKTGSSSRESYPVKSTTLLAFMDQQMLMQASSGHGMQSKADGETEDSFTKATDSEELEDTLSGQEGQADDPDEAQVPPCSSPRANGLEISEEQTFEPEKRLDPSSSSATKEMNHESPEESSESKEEQTHKVAPAPNTGAMKPPLPQPPASSVTPATPAQDPPPILKAAKPQAANKPTMSKGKSLQTPAQKQQPAPMGGFGGAGPVAKKPPIVKKAPAPQRTPAPSTPQDSRTPKSQAPRHQMQPTLSASTPITQRKRPLDAACRPSGEASRGILQEAQRQQPPRVQGSGIQSADDGALSLKASDRVGNFAISNDMADGLELENMGRNKISKIPQPMSDVQWNDKIITLLDRVRDSKGYLDEVRLECKSTFEEVDVLRLRVSEINAEIAFIAGPHTQCSLLCDQEKLEEMLKQMEGECDLDMSIDCEAAMMECD